MPTGVYKRSEEHKQNIGNALKGRVFSDEWKTKLSKAQKKMQVQANHKTNCVCCICKAARGETSGENNSFYGKHHTDETKAKLSKIKADYLKNAGSQTKKTSYEDKVEAVIIKNKLPYKYIGDGSFWIVSKGKHMNPDFMHKSQKIVVEVFANIFKEYSYGSVENYITERSRLLSNKGYSVIFITEEDIESEDCEKIILRKL